MNGQEKIAEFIAINDKEEIIAYSEKLHENLKDMNDKEEKLGLWFLIVLLLYILLGSSSMENINIGLITINDISVVSKLLPLVMTYVVFNIYTITIHKKEVMMALNTISEKRFNQEPLTGGSKELSRRFIIKLFFPYSFSNAISSIISEKPNLLQVLIGFILLLPTFIIGLIPYGVLIFMTINLYKNYTTDLLGWVCFGCTIWGISLLIFSIWHHSKLKD